MSTTRITGKVKWFNSKAGYGFITACEGEHMDKDIFVHFSSIKSDTSHYKYLTQGEYVDFSLTKPETEKHEYHAVEVTGVKGGLILCETRRLAMGSSRNFAEPEGDVLVEHELPTKPVAVALRKYKTKPLVSKPSSDMDGFTDVKKRGPPRAKRA